MARKSSKKPQVRSTVVTTPPAPAEESSLDASTALDDLNDLYQFAVSFAYELEEFPEKVGRSAMFELETRIAGEVVGLYETLARVILDGTCIVPGLPPLVVRALRALGRRSLGWLDQWGWTPLAGPAWKAFFEARREHYRLELCIPYYQAMVDWCEAISADDEAWDSPAFTGAEKARLLGLVPTPGATLEESRKRATALNEKLLKTPVIGNVIPSFAPEEMKRFRAAVKVLADHVARENWTVRGEITVTDPGWRLRRVETVTERVPMPMQFGGGTTTTSASEYLGLTIDKKNGRIARAGYEPVEFGGKKLLFAIACRLIHNKSDYTSIEDLREVWSSAGTTDDPQTNGIMDTMSDLRKLLEPLSISVKNSRSLGYMLANPDRTANQAHTEAHTEVPRRRRGISGKHTEGRR